MRPRSMVILEVGFQDLAQKLFAEHNHVIQALAPDRANEPFHEWILPRTLCRRDDFLNSHPAHSLTKLLAVNLVPISEQEARRCLFGKCFLDLLCRPSSRWMFGDIEMQHTPAVMSDHYQSKQHAKARRRDGEKVDRD